MKTVCAILSKTAHNNNTVYTRHKYSITGVTIIRHILATFSPTLCDTPPTGIQITQII